MEVRFTGATKAARQLQAAALSGTPALATALFREANAIMTAAKQDYVPVNTGALRASGVVEPPVMGMTRVSVDMGFGGPAIPYAVRQHEDLTLRHKVGGPKYLEIPLKARLAGMPAVIKGHVDNAVRQAIQRLQKVQANVAAGRGVNWGMPLFRGAP